MEKSKVKWFDAKKGYGFIDHPEGGDDVFVHYSQIISEKDFKTLRTGQEVAFEINDGPKGLHALDVKPMEEPEEADAQEAGAEEETAPETTSEATSEAARAGEEEEAAEPAPSSPAAASEASEEEAEWQDEEDEADWQDDWTNDWDEDLDADPDDGDAFSEAEDDPDPMAGPSF